MPTPVAIVRAQQYHLDEVFSALSRALDLINGTGQLEKKGRTLLLKPNMLSGSEPSRATTTHPVFFEAAIILLKERGFHLIAGDSPAIESTHHAGKKSGLSEVAKRHDVPWHDFADAVVIPNPDGKLVRRFTITRAFNEVDAVVTLPKLKTHSQMYYTGAMKNIFGMIPGLEKARFHLRFPDRIRFARMIVDLNLLIRPALSLMDSIVGMQGSGPNNGYPAPLGIVLASYDPLALDTVACRIIGYDPLDIPILHEAYNSGSWVHDERDIEIVGESIKSVQNPFELIEVMKEVSFFQRGRLRSIPLLAPLAERIFVPRPFVVKKRCILCQHCIKICQAQAITSVDDVHGKSIIIDQSKCIRCYCCHEVCPADAIDLRKRWRSS